MTNNLIGQEPMDLIDLNGWQNQSRITNYAIENGMPVKYLGLYTVLVRYSFGYGEYKTKHVAMPYWVKKTGYSKPTFMAHIKWLVKNGYIKVITHQGYVEGGGSIPNAYSIILKQGMGYIKKPTDKITKKVKVKAKLSHEDAMRILNSAGEHDRNTVISELKKKNADMRAIGSDVVIKIEDYLSNDEVLDSLLASVYREAIKDNNNRADGKGW